MNKLFYFLLFCSVSGAGVLWWLMNTVGVEESHVALSNTETVKGLKIEDTHAPSIPVNSKPSVEGAQKEEKLEAKTEAETDAETQDKSKSDTEESLSLKGSSPSSSTLSDRPSRLSISSEPSGVNVFLDGNKIGVTPLERTLTNKVQKFRFEKEGYVPVEREAPAEKTSEGAYLSWRISMVPQQLPAAQKKLIDSVESYFLKGLSGPVFVQVKALSADMESRSSVVRLIQEMRTAIREEKIFGCEVSLGEKGHWYRILVGPFANKVEASKAMGFLKESLKLEDIFVAGAQSCL
jgi:hypothetical protein